MAKSSIPFLGEKFTTEIEIKEPRNHRELRRLLTDLRGLSAITDGTGRYDYRDAQGNERCKIYDVINALESLAQYNEPESLADAVAALDILRDMVDWNYADRRDENLLSLIRGYLAENVAAHEWGRE